jgi:hypothetical protein
VVVIGCITFYHIKLKVEIELSTSFANLLEEDLIIVSKFAYLVSNIKKRGLWCSKFFSSIFEEI